MESKRKYDRSTEIPKESVGEYNKLEEDRESEPELPDTQVTKPSRNIAREIGIGVSAFLLGGLAQWGYLNKEDTANTNTKPTNTEVIERINHSIRDNWRNISHPNENIKKIREGDLYVDGKPTLVGYDITDVREKKDGQKSMFRKVYNRDGGWIGELEMGTFEVGFERERKVLSAYFPFDEEDRLVHQPVDSAILMYEGKKIADTQIQTHINLEGAHDKIVWNGRPNSDIAENYPSILERGKDGEIFYKGKMIAE